MKAVVDASVILAVLMGESGMGGRLIGEFELAVENGELTAPDLLFYETVNGLKSNMLKGKINLDAGREAMAAFGKLGIGLVDMSKEGEKLLEIAQEYNLSGYDAAYVALARKVGTRVWSLDKRLTQAVVEN